MTFIFKKWQYFGTSQNGIEDKKNGTEGVFFFKFGVKVNNKLTVVLLKKRKKKVLTMVPLPLEISYILWRI